ncbi:hypothetical protein ACFL2V_02270, partial [Pseudomonadota bacterium]
MNIQKYVKRSKSIMLCRHSKVAALIAILLTISACTVPTHMRVRDGDDPANIDKDVRFRTTYYFRVFDQCGMPKVSSSGENGINKNGSIFDPVEEEERRIVN